MTAEQPSACGDKQGSHTGYLRHRTVGQPACHDCKVGHSAYCNGRWPSGGRPAESARVSAVLLPVDGWVSR